ncbi:MAG: UTP--glucose-1-phosphate uridylyltransferase [Pseudobdellovibrionaceae bacterium]
MTHITPVRKAIFPVAGHGTRLLPATKVLPKEMLTIVDRPLIQMAIEEAREASIEEFIFVISHGKEMLIEHFGAAPALTSVLEKRGKTELIEKIGTTILPEGSLQTAIQEQALGLGHAVWCARHLVGNEPFAVILPDDTVLGKEGCMAQMMRSYNDVGGNIIATCEIAPEDSTRYGILDIAPRKGNVLPVRGLVEKPKPEDAPSNMAIFGRYILQPEIFAILEKKETGAGGEIQLTDAMAKLIAEQKFHGLVFEGERLDCGSEVGFVKAQIAFALKKATLAPEIADYMAEKLRDYYGQQQTSQKRVAAL